MQKATVLILVIAALFTNSFAAEPEAPVKLEIGKATTYVDGPLRKDGLIDYVAAYEKIYGKGVTDQNNAVPLLLRGFGPTFYHDEDELKIVCKKLKVPVPPAKGDYLIAFSDWAIAVWNADATRINDARNKENLERWINAAPKDLFADARKRYPTVTEFGDDVRRQVIITTTTPWKPADFPLSHAWLTLVEKPLALVKQATERDRYFKPAPNEPDSTIMYGVQLPALGRIRDASKALCTRAMLRLQTGDRDGAWDDLRAVYRLAALMSQEPILITSLVGMSLDTLASDATIQLAIDHNQTEDQLRALIKSFTSLKPRESVVRTLEIGERFNALDTLTMLRRQGMEAVAAYARSIEFKAEPSKEQLDAFNNLLDVNIVLKELNAWCDDLVRSASGATFAERSKASKGFTERVGQLKTRVVKDEIAPADLDDLTEHLLARAMRHPAEKRQAMFSRDVAEVLSALVVPHDISGVTATDDMARTRRDLTLITLALAAHRAKHGKYPAALAELSPAYLAEIPKDRFTEKPLQYRAMKNGFLLYSVGTNLKDDGGAYRTAETEYMADLRVLVEDGKFVPAEPR